MKYLLLIYHNEAEFMKLAPEQMAPMYKEYGEFSEQLISSGKHIASNQLQPTATATTVRLRGGKRLVTDGPFAETKEQLGGFYLVDAKDLDDAIAIAARIPSARDGSIEVRPVVVQRQAAGS